MVDILNHTMQQLANGELALGIGLRQARTVDTAKIMKSMGYDWLFIDMEHGSMNLDFAVQLSVAAQDAGITPIVRVPGFEHHHATRALDGGAQGIVVPHVDTADVARQVVSNCKYPPQGHRSLTGALPQLDFAAVPIGEAAASINDATFIVVMIETPLALNNVEEIAAVPGINSLLIGTNDLCAEMGIPGQFDHPDVRSAYARVIAACQENNIHPGMGGVYDLQLMEEYIGMGMRFILSASDLSLMMIAGKQRVTALQNMPKT